MGGTGHRNRPVDEYKRKMENLLSAFRWEKINIKVSSGTLKIKKNEMGGACGVYGGGERCAQCSGGEA